MAETGAEGSAWVSALVLSPCFLFLIPTALTIGAGLFFHVSLTIIDQLEMAVTSSKEAKAYDSGTLAKSARTQKFNRSAQPVLYALAPQHFGRVIGWTIVRTTKGSGVANGTNKRQESSGQFFGQSQGQR